MTYRNLLMIATLVCGMVSTTSSRAAELWIAAGTVDLTPDKPVAISGQFNLRIARRVETPITANVVVLESRDGEQSLDAAIMVSCDVVGIPRDVLAMVRERVAVGVPDLEPNKIFLSATHTHTAPVLRLDKYPVPREGVMQVSEYREWFAQRVAEAIMSAWKRRAPGSVTWGLSHAVVAYNRRAKYADGSAQMYGRTDVPEFRNLEGYEDHDVDTLFFFDAAGKPTAVIVTVACPAQEVESRSTLNADFWHPVREQLRKRYGEDLCVLGWTGASGDQSPHLMYRREADERMRRLRGLTRLEEIARRIVRAVDDAYEVVHQDHHTDVPLVHRVETLQLPMRPVNETEYAEAKTICDRLREAIEKDPNKAEREYRRMKWYEVTVQRYEQQQAGTDPTHAMELHVIRLGDVAICTNAFELFTDYGIRIKARSRATQTIVVQLTGPGTYLPTAQAVRGGHYSAVVHSSLVGPEGGAMLVDRTVQQIDALFPPPEQQEVK